jgi:phosphatidylglycerol lysyltransferase
MLVYPFVLRRANIEGDRKRARQIVAHYGDTALSRLTVLDDKSYAFSPSGEAVVAYVTQGGAAIALGDVIGPEEDAPAAIVSFCQLCARQNLSPAFYQVLPENTLFYQQAGLDMLCIGDDAVVPLASFNLDVHSHHSLRTAVHRMKHLGYSTKLHWPPLSEELLDDLQAISDEWLTSMRATEKRFSLGWFDDNYVRDTPVMVVYAADGETYAFANLLCESHKGEIAADLVRHRQRVPDGILEFLFVSMLQWAKEQNYVQFNLGLSAQAELDAPPASLPDRRTLEYVFEHLDQLYRFQGSYAFKQQFHPEWQPRYLAFAGWADFSKLSENLLRANT